MTTEPIISRHYTLTHSDMTAELFLTIGLSFAYDKINPVRDEVLGEWMKMGACSFYYVYLHVDGPFGKSTAAKRNGIFRRELPLALEAIRYGDRTFFDTHPEFNYSPMLVHFISTCPQFNRVEHWGSFFNYK